MSASKVLTLSSVPQLASHVVKVNIGCGTSGAKGWHNFDNSPTIWLAKIPFARKLLRVPHWPADVRRHNVLRGLPFPDSSVDCIYSSHTFEHFSFEESLKVARECCRVLTLNGVFRVVVPDLRLAIDDYLGTSDPMASHQFVERLLLTQGVRDLVHRGSHHRQMFDANSLIFLFREAGFQRPAVRKFRDSSIPDIDAVELESRRAESLYVEALKLSATRTSLLEK